MRLWRLRRWLARKLWTEPPPKPLEIAQLRGGPRDGLCLIVNVGTSSITVPTLPHLSAVMLGDGPAPQIAFGQYRYMAADEIDDRMRVSSTDERHPEAPPLPLLLAREGLRARALGAERLLLRAALSRMDGQADAAAQAARAARHAARSGSRVEGGHVNRLTVTGWRCSKGHQAEDSTNCSHCPKPGILVLLLWFAALVAGSYAVVLGILWFGYLVVRPLGEWLSALLPPMR